MDASPTAPAATGDENAMLARACTQFREELLAGIPDRRGIVKKLGGLSMGLDALKSVVDRWAELRGPVLEYYSDFKDAGAADRRPKGALVMDEHSVLTAPAATDRRALGPYTFELRTVNRTELFATGSEAEWQGWVNAITSVLETLRRFGARPLPPVAVAK